MTEMPHYCSACGQVHGGQQATSPEVEVARINAERDIQVAKLGARQSREINETTVAVAEVESAAHVEASEAVAEVVVAGVAESESESEPEVVIVPETEPEPEPEAEAEPPEASGSPVPRETGKKRGWWDAYR